MSDQKYWAISQYSNLWIFVFYFTFSLICAFLIQNENDEKTSSMISTTYDGEPENNCTMNSDCNTGKNDFIPHPSRKLLTEWRLNKSTCIFILCLNYLAVSSKLPTPSPISFRFWTHHPKTATSGAITNLRIEYFQYQDSWSSPPTPPSARTQTWPALECPNPVLTAKVKTWVMQTLLVPYNHFYNHLHLNVNTHLAVVEALKTLQEKIKRLEQERIHAEKSYREFSHNAPKHQQATSSYTVLSQPAASLPSTENLRKKGKCWRFLQCYTCVLFNYQKCFDQCVCLW